MSTDRYVQHISDEIAKGLYEATKEMVTASFKSTGDASKFAKEASKLGVKNISVTMKHVSFEPKNEQEIFKIMPLVDKYNGEIK